MDIPEVPPFTVGMFDFTVNSGETAPIAPGTYPNWTVNPGGTIVFSAGSYIFGSLVVGNDATTAKFDVAMNQSIGSNVQYTLEFRDRATVNDWIIVSGRAAYEAIYGMVGKATAMIIVEPEAVNSMASYLDGGEVYSTSSAFSVVETKITLSGVTAPTTPGTKGAVTIDYKNAAGTAQTPIIFDLVYKNGGYLMSAQWKNRFEYKEQITVTNVAITYTPDALTFTLPCNTIIKTGETVTFFVNKSLTELKSTDVIGEKLTAEYNANTLAFESIAFAEGVIKKTPPPDPYTDPTWFYHFYQRDHLGSTRMVLSNGDDLVEMKMFQPYGTMDDVIPPAAGGSEPVRQRFTGKELDKEGKTSGVGGAPGMGLMYFGKRYYDADLAIWTSTDPAQEFFSSYRYLTNPINSIDFFGLAEIRIAIFAEEFQGPGSENEEFWEWRWNKQLQGTGDHVIVRVFNAENVDEMAGWLNGGDKSGLGTHHAENSLTFSDNKGGRIIVSKLNDELEKPIVVSACEFEKTKKLNKASLKKLIPAKGLGKGAENHIYITVAKSLGVPVNKEINIPLNEEGKPIEIIPPREKSKKRDD